MGAESITSVSGLTLGGASAGNYTLVGASGSVNINALALTLTVTGSRTYNGTSTASASILTISKSNQISGRYIDPVGGRAPWPAKMSVPSRSLRSRD